MVNLWIIGEMEKWSENIEVVVIVVNKLCNKAQSEKVACHTMSQNSTLNILCHVNLLNKHNPIQICHCDNV